MTGYSHGFAMMAHTGDRKNGSKIAEKMAHSEIEKNGLYPEWKKWSANSYGNNGPLRNGNNG